jgi:ribonuclease HI
MTTSGVIHFDGVTRPDNPGPAAIGYIIETDDWTEEGSDHIGDSTSNRTEYYALIRKEELHYF